MTKESRKIWKQGLIGTKFMIMRMTVNPERSKNVVEKPKLICSQLNFITPEYILEIWVKFYKKF